MIQNHEITIMRRVPSHSVSTATQHYAELYKVALAIVSISSFCQQYNGAVSEQNRTVKEQWRNGTEESRIVPFLSTEWYQT